MLSTKMSADLMTRASDAAKPPMNSKSCNKLSLENSFFLILCAQYILFPYFNNFIILCDIKTYPLILSFLNS